MMGRYKEPIASKPGMIKKPKKLLRIARLELTKKQIQQAIKFYRKKSREDIHAIQAKVYGLIRDKKLKLLEMKPGVADNNFVKNVWNAQIAMGIKPKFCNGKWLQKHDKKYNELASNSTLSFESSYSVFYALPEKISGSAEAPEPELAEIPKPIPEVDSMKVNGKYRIKFKTPDEYTIVVGSNKPFRTKDFTAKEALAEGSINPIIRKAILKGHIFDADGNHYKLDKTDRKIFWELHVEKGFRFIEQVPNL